MSNLRLAEMSTAILATAQQIDRSIDLALQEYCDQWQPALTIDEEY